MGYIYKRISTSVRAREVMSFVKLVITIILSFRRRRTRALANWRNNRMIKYVFQNKPIKIVTHPFPTNKNNVYI